ncbi:MAG: aminoglycoside phosphotransferase family protein [Clostridia bacterium]|nr:aminoglycoside phosphotransferase family protein [Clostridia bacterium]
MDNNISNLDELLEAYGFDKKPVSVDKITDGHINSTYVFDFGGEKYLFQHLNTNVFRRPVELMNNIVGITDFLRKIIAAKGGNPDRECLTVLPAKDGKPYYISQGGEFWRSFTYISGAHTIQTVKNASDFRAAAEAFGNFQRQLAGYPAESLAETIPNFHNTVSRFADFKKAVSDNISGRAGNCKTEIDFILARESDCSVLTDMIERNELPLRVTHNDTKLNNVMFDNDTGKAICVVDLDTVMPGLSLYDFGDSIRFGASTAAEDEKDLDKVNFSMEYFRAYTEGYLSTAGKALTENEIKYLPFSSKLMTLECGMRFLGDYINGDTYFGISYPEHNLVRAKTQLKLVSEMEKNMPEMEKAVAEIRAELGI